MDRGASFRLSHADRRHRQHRGDRAVPTPHRFRRADLYRVFSHGQLHRAVPYHAVAGWPFPVASTVSGVECVRMAARYNVVAGLSTYGLQLLLNLVVPFGVQVVVHVLSSDAVRADSDELTGLLTRRAFRRRAKACLASESAAR